MNSPTLISHLHRLHSSNTNTNTNTKQTTTTTTNSTTIVWPTPSTLSIERWRRNSSCERPDDRFVRHDCRQEQLQHTPLDLFVAVRHQSNTHTHTHTHKNEAGFECTPQKIKNGSEFKTKRSNFRPTKRTKNDE